MTEAKGYIMVLPIFPHDYTIIFPSLASVLTQEGVYSILIIQIIDWQLADL